MHRQDSALLGKMSFQRTDGQSHLSIEDVVHSTIVSPDETGIMSDLYRVGMHRSPSASIAPARLPCDLGNEVGRRRFNVRNDDINHRIELCVNEVVLRSIIEMIIDTSYLL